MRSLALDDSGRQVGVPLPGVHPALPSARLGRARRDRDLGGGRRRRSPSWSPRSTSRSAAIGITDQRETVVAWDRRTGEPRHRAIVWQDRRTAARCDELAEAGHLPLVRATTGLVLDPVLLRRPRSSGSCGRRPPVAAAWRPTSTSRSGTIDTWLLWQLTGGAVHATEPSNASRTMLFDIRTLGWSDELCDLFGVPDRPPSRDPPVARVASARRAATPASRPASRSPASPATSRPPCSARRASNPA